MMKAHTSDVFFANLRTGFKENLLQKVARLFHKAGLRQVIKQDDLVAIKIHVGEAGGTAYVRPDFVRVIVDEV